MALFSQKNVCVTDFNLLYVPKIYDTAPLCPEDIVIDNYA